MGVNDATEIKFYYWGEPKPQEVRVSFSLPYRDWCKLESSWIWHRLERLLEAIQSRVPPPTRRKERENA